jgi:hypothetical protein
MVQTSSRFTLASSRSAPRRLTTATENLTERAALAEGEDYHRKEDEKEEGLSSVLVVEADAPAAVSTSSKAEPLPAAGNDDASFGGSPTSQQHPVGAEVRAGRGARAASLRLSVPSVVPLSPEFVCLKVRMGKEDGPASLAVVDVAMTPRSLDVF